jgi:hypothetical protein
MTKTIAEKLGMKAGLTGWAPNRPDDLAQAIPFPASMPGRKPDIIIAFVAAVADMPDMLKIVLPQYARGASLWFAYPKKTGRIKTDLSRDHGWDLLTERDLLPVTQIAIDETWSALRFRYRDEISRLTRKNDLPGKRKTS